MYFVHFYFNCALLLHSSWTDLQVFGFQAVKRSGQPYLSLNTVPMIGPFLHHPPHISLRSCHQRSPQKKRSWLSLKKWWYVFCKIVNKSIVATYVKPAEALTQRQRFGLRVQIKSQHAECLQTTHCMWAIRPC